MIKKKVKDNKAHVTADEEAAKHSGMLCTFISAKMAGACQNTQLGYFLSKEQTRAASVSGSYLLTLGIYSFIL